MYRGVVRTLIFALLFAPAVFAENRLSVVPLFSLSYPPPPIALSDDGAFAITDRHLFLGTDDGLYRAPLPLGSATPQRVAFASTPVTALAWSDGVLYATLGSGEHALMKSTDDGATWQSLDAQLEECIGQFCGLLRASQVEARGDRLFVNAGGNMLVTGDAGATWSILQGASSTGKPQGQACYDPSFALVGERLLLGGECPLDVAYLRTGTLAANGLAWQEEPVEARTPFLENRNVQFIQPREGNVVFAGIEGALLRSNDAGASYDFVLRYELDAVKYPYITHVLFPAERVIVIGGFDKANGGPFLAASFDDGATWRDESSLLMGVGKENWSVAALARMPDGSLIVAVEDDDNGAMYVYELRVVDSSRRRAVRH